MKKKIPTINELLEREVRRPHVDIEWLSKLSSSEFWAWCDREADIIRFRGGTSREAVNLHIEAEIKNQENLYQLLKDVNTNKNGLKKAKNRIELGGRFSGVGSIITHDIVSKPSTRNAAIMDLKDHYYEPMTASTKNVYYDPKSLYGEKFVYEKDYKEKYLKRSV